MVRRTTRVRIPIAWAALLACLLGAAPSSGRDKRARDLPERFQEWLEVVELLITENERDAFLELENDYQRDAFIRRFWEARNPDPGSHSNRYQEVFLQQRAEALSRFKTMRDDRARLFTLHGEPGEVEEMDCGLVLWPLEIWRYGYSQALGRGFKVIFLQSGGGGPFRLWRPAEGYEVLVALRLETNWAELIRERCTQLSFDEVEDFLAEFELYGRLNPMGPVEAEVPPRVLDTEWLRTFHAFSTDAPADAEPLEVRLELSFPGRRGQRAVVEGRLEVAAAEATVAEIAGRRAYNFQLTGEVLVERYEQPELFESFRYRYDLLEGDGSTLPLVFERHLRPGSYRLVLKLDDLNGAGVARVEQALEVPSLNEVGESSEVASVEPGDEAEAAEPGATDLELAAEGGDFVSGLFRVAATAGRGITKARFFLDERPILTKTRPPFAVELNLGSLPVPHRVRVVGLDAAGNEVATDEIVVNPGEHVFAVRLVEPRRAVAYSGVVRARAEVQLPEGARLERVEFFHGDEPVATLFQEPFVHPVEVVGGVLSFVRVVAYLEDGSVTEDLVVFNTGDLLEEVKVRLVEVYASVRDASGRPIPDLRRDAFRVLENGSEQQLLRFEHLDDLPVYAALLIDTSASMAESLDRVRAAAADFFDKTIRPRDRAAVITFSEQPRLAAAFTNDQSLLVGALAGLSAEQSTALYDSLMYALYYFRGVTGQRALLLLSDGEDRRSKATFDEVLAFARGAGVTIYAVGLQDALSRAGRNELTRMAEETGGQAFFVGAVDELPAVYDAIQSELRSRYLLVYQSPPGAEGFRAVDVQVDRQGLEVRALKGYLP
jgi:Ca-activated chloride channel family protein